MRYRLAIFGADSEEFGGISQPCAGAMPLPLILVIDDDKLFRWAVSTVLERAGYRVGSPVRIEKGGAAMDK